MEGTCILLSLGLTCLPPPLRPPSEQVVSSVCASPSPALCLGGLKVSPIVGVVRRVCGAWSPRGTCG